MGSPCGLCVQIRVVVFNGDDIAGFNQVTILDSFSQNTMPLPELKIGFNVVYWMDRCGHQNISNSDSEKEMVCVHLILCL